MKKKYFLEEIELCLCKIISHRKDSSKDICCQSSHEIMKYTTTTNTTTPLTLNIHHDTVSKSRRMRGMDHAACKTYRRNTQHTQESCQKTLGQAITLKIWAQMR